MILLALDGITIYFAPNAYQSLQNVMAPWGGIRSSFQPDIGLPADGFLDLLVGPLQGLVGPFSFSIDFQFLGTGVPGSQRFELYNASPFAVVLSDQTQPSQLVGTFPELGTVALAALAIGLLFRFRPRSVNDSEHRPASARG